MEENQAAGKIIVQTWQPPPPGKVSAHVNTRYVRPGRRSRKGRVRPGRKRRFRPADLGLCPNAEVLEQIIPLLSASYQTIAADLPSFGDSGILTVPATTENVGKIFHEFVKQFSPPLHVVAHDFGAWVAFSWGLMFPDDFKSLTLIDAGIPGITLMEDIQLSDFKRKWNFIFQMLPDLPAELARGKEDIYVGWWFRNKMHDPSAISPADVAAYVAAYARPGRMDAAMDYCRRILDDIAFNQSCLGSRLEIPLLAVGGQHAIPNMGESLAPYFRNVTSVVIPNSGHFVPEEQPEALANELMPFLEASAREHALP